MSATLGNPITPEERQRENAILENAYGSYAENEIESRVAEQIEIERMSIRRDTLVALATKLRNFKNPLLALDCLLFIVSSALTMGESETQICQRYGIGRAAFSKTVCRVADELGLPPGAGMRTLEARGIYSERAKKVHVKKQNHE